MLDADIAGGTGVHHFRKAHPERFLQFGIAEQNMMAAAGGLAAVGMLPVVTTFAVFCLRAIEQARLSIAYAKRNVKIVASHPGLDVGPDGGSAQALEDLAAFRAIPGMTVISPADPIEMALATKAVLDFDGPVYMRTGRSGSQRLFGDDHRFEIGKGQILRDGSDVTIVACGVEVARALGRGRDCSRRKASRPASSTCRRSSRSMRPCSTAAPKETGAIVTAEDHNIYGGLGGAVAEALAQIAPCADRICRPCRSLRRIGRAAGTRRALRHRRIAIADAARRVIARKRHASKARAA